MIRAIAEHPSHFLLIVGFLVFSVVFKFFMKTKKRLVDVRDIDGGIPSFSGRYQRTSSPVDDWEPSGNVIADNLNMRVILHYSKPSGRIELHDVIIKQLHGIYSPHEIRIGSLSSRNQGKKSPSLIYQFYRLHAVEDPITGEIFLNDKDKALWLAQSAGLLTDRSQNDQANNSFPV